MAGRRMVEAGRKLRAVLLGWGKLPITELAILVDEDGRLRPFRISGQPNYVSYSRDYLDMEAAVVRTVTYRYVRTDLTCQTGHRIYVISEIFGEDAAIDEPRPHSSRKARRSDPTRVADLPTG